MKIFDTHAHLGLVKDDQISQLIVAQEALSRGIVAIVNVCNNLQDFAPLYQNLSKSSNVYFAIGISPSEVANTNFKWDDEVERFAKEDRVIAIGETGLDRKFGNKDRQIEFFIRHIEIAGKLQLPIIIHNRDAGQEIYDVLSELNIRVPIILHCYSEDWSYAQKILSITENVYFSFTGSVSYKTARKLRDVAGKIPEKNILVESESPFMSPLEVKGTRNRPIYISYTIAHLAKLRDVDPEELSTTLYENSCKAFNLYL